MELEPCIFFEKQYGIAMLADVSCFNQNILEDI